MNRKIMNAAVIFLITGMILFLLTGCEFSAVNKVVLADGVMDKIEYFEDIETKDSAHGVNIYSASWEDRGNEYKRKELLKIPEGKDLYANILFIESPKGMKYKVKWLEAGTVVKEDEKEMTTDQKGVLWFLIEGEKIKKGKHSLEIFYKDKKVSQLEFDVEAEK
ncbi:MAG: hypothetical protein N2484_10905 [Clostridia bacterium]|nr:hypothetical protein [Clostridia bacterium]